MSKDVGDVWVPTLTVRDEAGALTAATVVLSVTSPSGTASTVPNGTATTGVYTPTSAIPLTERGRWIAVWTVSGTVTGVESQSVYVRSVGANIIDYGSVKARLNKTLTVDDDEIEEMLDAAVDEYMEWVGPVGEVTETFSGGTDRLILRAPNVTEVTAAAYADGTVIEVADLLVDNGIVYWGYGTAGFFQWGTRNVTVTYTVGALPANHRETIIADVAGYFEATQRSNGGAAFPGEGFDEAPYRTSPMVLFPRIRALAPPRVA